MSYIAEQHPFLHLPGMNTPPFSVEAHSKHVESLAQHGSFDVFGYRFDTTPGMYQPHPWSSSVFFLRSLLRDRPAMGRMLELGCGSGIIGLSLLAHDLASQAVLTDIAPQCVDVARRNALALGLEDRVALLHGNLFEPVAGQRFDTLLFNMPLLHREHDGARHCALDDVHGQVATRFFEQAPTFLEPGGRGYFMFSNVSDPALLQAFAHTVKLQPLAAELAVRRGFSMVLYEFSL